MMLDKIKIGSFVEPYVCKCNKPNLTVYDVSGINREKEFFEPSKQVGSDTSDYKIVPPNYFACNLMHVGRDIVLPISLNHTSKDKIVSPAYTVFKIKDNSVILNEYFFMFLKSKEKDRFFWFHTDSSVRDGLDWESFCDVDIVIPDIDTQKKYVNIYKSLLNSQESYSSKMEDLNNICKMYLEELKKEYSMEPISKYCVLSDLRNDNNECKNVKGLTVYKDFIDTKADMNGVSLKSYKVVNVGDIAYVPTTNRNGDRIACGIANEKCVVSSTYEVINVIDKEKLYPDYLFMWFKREEMDRFARYNSWGSARETITWEDLSSYKIPVPEMSKQISIVNIHKALLNRKKLYEDIKSKIDYICPILINGSLMEVADEQ